MSYRVVETAFLHRMNYLMMLLMTLVELDQSTAWWRLNQTPILVLVDHLVPLEVQRLSQARWVGKSGLAAAHPLLGLLEVTVADSAHQ